MSVEDYLDLYEPPDDEGRMYVVPCVYLHETDKAYLVQVRTKRGGTREVWLPKSQVERVDDSDAVIERDTDIELLVPEWLTVKNDLPGKAAEDYGDRRY